MTRQAVEPCDIGTATSENTGVSEVFVMPIHKYSIALLQPSFIFIFMTRLNNMEFVQHRVVPYLICYLL